MRCSQLDGLLVSTSRGDISVRSQVEVSNLLVDVIQVFCAQVIMDVLSSRGRSSAWTILGGPGHRRQTGFDHRQIREGRQDGSSSRGRLLSYCFIAFCVAAINIFDELASFRVRLSERMVLFPFASSQEYTIDYRSDKTIGKCYYKHPHQRRPPLTLCCCGCVCVQAGLMNLLL